MWWRVGGYSKLVDFYFGLGFVVGIIITVVTIYLYNNSGV